MPAVRTYVVTQEREVRVAAESPAAAVHIADQVFNNGSELADVDANVRSPVKDLSITSREEF